MKRWIAMCLVMVLMAGCAGDYGSYTQAKIRQAQLAGQQKPLVDMSYTDSGGKPVKMTINLPKDLPPIEQQRPNEWAAALKDMVLGVAPWAGVGYVVGKLVGKIGDSTTVNAGGDGMLNQQTAGTSATVTPKDPVVVTQPPPVIVDPVIVGAAP